MRLHRPKWPRSYRKIATNANSHDTKNLPLLLAGGRFRHGQHLMLDREKNTPLCNLFVQIAQQMGHEIEQFGSSSAAVSEGLRFDQRNAIEPTFF